MSNVDKGTARERITERIQSAKLINRLEAFALALTTDENYDKVQMNQTQVAAARIVLAKSVPDIKQVESIIKDERKKTREQIDAQLIANGIDPEVVWQSHAKH